MSPQPHLSSFSLSFAFSFAPAVVVVCVICVYGSRNLDTTQQKTCAVLLAVKVDNDDGENNSKKTTPLNHEGVVYV